MNPPPPRTEAETPAKMLKPFKSQHCEPKVETRDSRARVAIESSVAYVAETPEKNGEIPVGLCMRATSQSRTRPPSNRPRIDAPRCSWRRISRWTVNKEARKIEGKQKAEGFPHNIMGGGAWRWGGGGRQRKSSTFNKHKYSNSVS